MPHPWSTPRLLIRRFVLEDWQDLHNLQGDPEATALIGGPWSAEKTREVIKAIVESYLSNEMEWLAVADRETGKVLGTCWLGKLNPKWCEALAIRDPIQLGYRYARQYWGQGYATEAARTMLERGFHELNLQEIIAIVDVRNVASERVLKKLGMKYRSVAYRDGVKIHCYTITRDEFLSSLIPFPVINR